jgi:hypothetical protein
MDGRYQHDIETESSRFGRVGAGFAKGKLIVGWRTLRECSLEQS